MSDALGSPPRAWGQLQSLEHRSVSVAVHPHVRGDNDCHRVHRRRDMAVHPHVRGDNCRRCCRDRSCARFTPTCVGTTASHGIGIRRPSGSPPRAWGQLLARAAASVHRSVHPHVRGDNAASLATSMRRARFTPTCVGTIVPTASLRRRPFGSPPRAWGQLHRMPASSN